MIDRRSHRDTRVVIVAPRGRDGELAYEVLERAGIPAVCCLSLNEVVTELEYGAGALLIVEEAIVSAPALGLTEWLANQPPWSDLPVLVLARPGADSDTVRGAMDRLGNVTVLERPTRIAALVSAARSAIRARRRQYQIRKQLEEREQHVHTQELLAAIVASSDDAIIGKTLDGRILTWNAGAERLFGYTAVEVIGKPITILIPPERRDEEPRLLERLRRGERIEHFETVRVTKAGQQRIVSLTVSPVRDASGTIIGASKMARDITEAKRAEEALRQAQEHLQLVTDNMPIAVTRCSRDLRYLWANPTYAAWFGGAGIDLKNRTIAEVLGEEVLQSIKPNIERVLAGERVEYEQELPFKGRPGKRWIKAAYVPTHDPTGAVNGWVAVIIDTSAHHELEAALREADRRKDEFLAMLAHELRNPLAPILSSLQILGLASSQDPSIAGVREVLERQVNHMVRLVDDLMEVSRITRGKIELKKAPVDLAGVLRSAVETSLPLIQAARHELTISSAPDSLTVTGDSVRLTQVISNLLNNAAKYTDPGGRIWITVAREGNEAVIKVRDTGTGIPRDMLPRIFELFTQVDHSVARTQGGLGIGLTLVKRLVELHGGTVQALSEGPAKGSEFIVRLPLATAMGPRSVTAQDRAPVAPLTHRNILLVDDNRDAAESMRILLKVIGAEARVVYDGAKALGVLDLYKPDAVLLDIGMPGMDGFEVAHRIRQRPDGGRFLLIALSGWGQEEDRRRSEAAGFDHHLVKPADVKTLQKLLSAPPRTAPTQQAS